MKTLLISILILTCMGCAYRWNPVCRHDVFVSATVVGEMYPIRLVIGSTESGKHIQAQAFIAGKWEWLVYDGKGVNVGKQDCFKPVFYISLSKYWNFYQWFLIDKNKGE